MIQRISFGNFKSFRRAELPLVPLTFLVGANGSGKSTAVEAIQMLSWLGSGRRLEDLPSAIAEGELSLRGALTDLAEAGRISLECRILTSWDPPEADYSLLLEVGGDGLRVAGERLESPAFGVLSETPGRFPSEVREARVLYGGPESAEAAMTEVRHALGRALFLHPDPRRMRESSPIRERRLKNDGSNLSSVLRHLGSAEPILDFLRSTQEGDIGDLSFVETAGKVMVRLHETHGGRSVPREAAVLSDGTLRLLAVAAALFSAPEGSLVVLEEIENGVYPSRAGSLVSSLRRIAQERGLRILLPTHHPALLDALPWELVPDAIACYRDPEEGDSRLLRLDDLESYPELVAQGRLGELVTDAIFDRHLKTPEWRDRDKMVAKGRAWLAELRKQTGLS